MKKVKVDKAIGCALFHDITEINLDKNFKGIAFKRGHIISSNDIEKLKKLGKEFVYIEDNNFDSQYIHEDDAANILSPLIAGYGISFDLQPKEGKINFYSDFDGILKINKKAVLNINKLEIPSLPTLHNNYPVKKGELVAAFRIIPLFCEKVIIDKCINFLKKPAIYIKPYILKKASIIVTGNEIYNGLVEDRFIPIISKKLNNFDVKLELKEILPDKKDLLVKKIKKFIEKTDILFITGGTSVDPDDITKSAILEANIKILQFGNPIQPGNNLTIGYFDKKPVIAVPAATLFFKATALDIFLPRLIANDKINKNEIYKHSIGGLCHFCKICTFPKCSFGKI